MKILRPKRESENMEFPFNNVKKQKLVAVNFNKWRCEHKCQKHPTHHCSIVVKLSFWFLRKNKISFSAFVYGPNGVSKFLFIFCFHPKFKRQFNIFYQFVKLRLINQPLGYKCNKINKTGHYFPIIFKSKNPQKRVYHFKYNSLYYSAGQTISPSAGFGTAGAVPCIEII